MNNDEHSYHPEEISNAEKEGRPVLLSRLYRHDHMKHNIPIGTIVSVDVKIDEEDAKRGTSIKLTGTCNLIVISHNRDCDGTPLYSVSDIPVRYPSEAGEHMKYAYFSKFHKHGYPESSLTPTTNKKIKLYSSVLTWVMDE